MVVDAKSKPLAPEAVVNRLVQIAAECRDLVAQTQAGPVVTNPMRDLAIQAHTILTTIAVSYQTASLVDDDTVSFAISQMGKLFDVLGVSPN